MSSQPFGFNQHNASARKASFLDRCFCAAVPVELPFIREHHNDHFSPLDMVVVAAHMAGQQSCDVGVFDFAQKREPLVPRNETRSTLVARILKYRNSYIRR